jgi:hypothetical protein
MVSTELPPRFATVGSAKLGRFLYGSARLVVEPGRCIIDARGLLALFAGVKSISRSAGTIAVRRVRWRPFWASVRVQLGTRQWIDIRRWQQTRVHDALIAAGFTVSERVGDEDATVDRDERWSRATWFVAASVVALIALLSVIHGVYGGTVERINDGAAVVVCGYLIVVALRRANYQRRTR